MSIFACRTLPEAIAGHQNKNLDQALSLSAIGEYEEAIKLYTEALKDPKVNSAEAHKSRGRSHLNVGNYGAAISDFSVYIKEHPNSISAPYIHRGHAYAKLNRHKEAIKDFEKGMAVESTRKPCPKPGNLSTLYMARGRSYQLSDQFDKAVADYTKSLLLKPTSVQAGTITMWRKQALAGKKN